MHFCLNYPILHNKLIRPNVDSMLAEKIEVQGRQINRNQRDRTRSWRQETGPQSMSLKMTRDTHI